MTDVCVRRAGVIQGRTAWLRVYEFKPYDPVNPAPVPAV